MAKQSGFAATLGKRAKTKALNRQTILAAARTVFARIGYDATNIRDIIRETNLASGTFYNYFKSKEEVFEAIADDSVLRFRPLLDEVRKNFTTLDQYLFDAYFAYFDFLAKENDSAISSGAPHMALIGVRVDTPEMKAVSDTIRSDLEMVLMKTGHGHIDIDYLSAAAIGIARELGDRMLLRRPVDPAAAAKFASRLLLAGINQLSASAASDQAGS